MKEVTVQELKIMQDNGEDIQLIDVREKDEFAICNINGLLIPMGEISNYLDKISRDKKVICHCKSGARSINVVKWLEKRHGFNNIYNLKGGIIAWSDQIDPSVIKY